MNFTRYTRPDGTARDWVVRSNILTEKALRARAICCACGRTFSETLRPSYRHPEFCGRCGSDIENDNQ